MNFLKKLLFLLATLMICWSLDDAEIERIKKLVDEELLTREAEIAKSQQKKVASEGAVKGGIKIHPDSGNEPFHPLVRVKATTTASPPVTTTAPTTKKVQTATTTTTTTTTATAEPTVDPHEEKLQHSIDNCIDIYETKKCQHLISAGVSCEKDHMDFFCERSCRFCAAPGHHIDCMKTTYGCCDDGITPRSNPYGKGCPVCEDNVPALCEPHISDCNEVGMVGNWMRTNCKKTCEVCQPTPTGPPIVKTPCKDDEVNGRFCKEWANSGLCQLIPDLMMNQCRKTCSKCETEPNPSFNSNNNKKSS